MTNLATVQPQPLAGPSNPFEPQNLQQAMTLAETISKSGLVPSALRGKPSDILIILMTAREMRIGPMQALSDINVIQGKAVLSADLMVAQCKRAPNRCEFFRLVESTDDHATYEVKAAGTPEAERFTFTMDDARKLHLTDKDNWKKQPKTMLRRRAAAQAARETFPDLVRGYDPDEAEDFARTVRQVEAINPAPAPLPEQAPATDVHAEPVPAETVEAEKPPAKPPTPPHVHALWDALVGQFGDDKPKIQAVVSRAATTLWGDVVPPKHAWTESDCAQLLKISQEEAAP